MNESDQTESEASESPPDFGKDVFLAWRSPRFGKSNPERMNNPVWEWLIRTRISAYQAGQIFGEGSSCGRTPGWCFDRFGRTSTALADGRTVWIGGEHEDFYDPDFHIYNDVVVRNPNGSADIYGYPAEVFQPTDFHSATLAGSRIVLIGCLGYKEQRRPGTTPIQVLNLANFSVERVASRGKAPGWIYEHTAHLEEGGRSILIRDGKLDLGGHRRFHAENIDEWRLHLEDWRWERVSRKNWERWAFTRKDSRTHLLLNIRMTLGYRQLGWEKEQREQMDFVAEHLGIRPDLKLAAELFRPSVAHELLSEDGPYDSEVRIRVGGIVVRYVMETNCVQMTVEGSLPADCSRALVADLTRKLEALQNTAVDVCEIRSP